MRRGGIWQLLEKKKRKKRSERDGNLQKTAGGLGGRSARERERDCKVVWVGGAGKQVIKEVERTSEKKRCKW